MGAGPVGPLVSPVLAPRRRFMLLRRLLGHRSFQIGAILDRFLNDWERRKPQYYGGIGGQQDDPLLWPAGKPIRPDIAYLGPSLKQTPSSMRNVDAECVAVPIQAYGPEATT